MEHIRFEASFDNLTKVPEVARIVAVANYYQFRAVTERDTHGKTTVTVEGTATSAQLAATALMALSAANYGKVAPLDDLGRDVAFNYNRATEGLKHIDEPDTE